MPSTLAQLIDYKKEFISLILCFAIEFLNLIEGLVSSEFLIPIVDEISFYLFSVTKAIIFIKLRFWEGTVEKDILFLLTYCSYSPSILTQNGLP